MVVDKELPCERSRHRDNSTRVRCICSGTVSPYTRRVVWDRPSSRQWPTSATDLLHSVPLPSFCYAVISLRFTLNPSQSSRENYLSLELSRVCRPLIGAQSVIICNPPPKGGSRITFLAGSKTDLLGGIEYAQRKGGIREN